MSGKTLTGVDDVMRAINDAVKDLGDGSLEVGFMENATYPDGTPVAGVAFWNEFGVPSRGQPARPFFRQMIANNSGKWAATIARLAKAKKSNILALMGEEIKGQLQKSINDLTTPALAPSTIAAKGFQKPLIATAHMLNSVTYRVVK